ncbi:MAG: AAA family ATPase [Deltaproteobacteria bacterium]|jgi:hypothetical protein|nr:AAA family ATPase [Deltaproteobacteria bacterium]
MDPKQPLPPKLPAGIQTFEEVRDRQAVYADKTKYFPLLPEEGKAVFCARPRRFGKSLTVSAPDAFFSGRNELFQGLAAREFMNSPGFTPRPVIHLDLSEADDCENRDELKEALMSCLEVNAERHKVSLRGSRCSAAFSNLLKDVSRAASPKIVLLTDECDAPVISLIQRGLTYDPKLVAEQARSFMRSFCTKIKSNDQRLEFVFTTGISKFSRLGVFSPPNSLADISLDSEFAAFMGLTVKELEVYFAPHFNSTAKQLWLNEKELPERIREYYDGFSFDVRTGVCSPFSALLFFRDGEFNSRWMESGSSGFIRKFLRDYKLTAEEFSGLRASRNSAGTPEETGAEPPEGFPCQAGYLPLREGSGGFCTLDCPSFEVRTALPALFMDNLYSSERMAEAAAVELGHYLAAGDVHNMAVIFMRLFSGLSSSDRKEAFSVKIDQNVMTGMALEQAEERPGVSEQNSALSFMESLSLKKSGNFCRSVLQTCLRPVGAGARPEAGKNRGQAHMKVKHKDQDYIIEMKIADYSPAALKPAQAGLTQLRDCDCGGASEKPIFISLAVDLKARNTGACVFVKNGQTSVLDSQDLLQLLGPPTEEADYPRPSGNRIGLIKDQDSPLCQRH